MPTAQGTPPEPTPDGQSLLEQLRDANEQLVVGSMRAQALVDEAEAARAEAETANRLKDEFLAILSHELRTPLSAILGWAGVLGGGQLDPARTASAIHTIERNARMLAQIIDDLLDVSRIIAGKVSIDPVPVDLVAVIQGAVDEVRLVAEAKAVNVIFTCPAVLGPVGGDTLRLQQVVANLLSNAVKFTPSGGRIDVRLTSTDSEVEVQVADTGEGITPAFLPRIFDRFSQADTAATPRRGGIGLGLAIVKALVELHGGTVRADSAGPGQGATFTVRIPILARRDAAEVKGAGVPDAAVVAAAPPPRLDGISVLVAEDDADVRHVLTVILELAGAKVTAVNSVRGALLALADVRPDVLVTDIGMPDEDGYALVRHLRAREGGAGGGLPAIALTGYVTVEDRARLLAAGFQLHLRKPADPSELVTAVASLATRPAGGA